MFFASELTEVFNTSGFGFKILVAYIGGLLTSLTPCVYPLIPVTIAILGVKKNANRIENIKHVSMYVLGIAISFTALGVFASKSGSFFGSALSSPTVRVLISFFFIILALIIVDILRIPQLSYLQNWAAKLGGKTYRGIFIMGLTSGLVAAPCVGPVLLLILTYSAVASESGAILLFSYSLGFSTIFILIGCFANLVKRIPKSGSWLNFTKYILAIALVYFSISFLPINIKSYFIQTDKSAELNWLNNFEIAKAQAVKDNKYILIDLSAEWCAACKELEEKTLSSPLAKEELSKLVLLRLDFTEVSEFTEEFSRKYEVLGLPCIMITDSAGNEFKALRITGFIEAQELMERIKSAGN